jgi:ATP-dependent exoDNAse (exonuclease V) beta subunit
MKPLADTPERLRALTDLESTLLVEAAAGTGKTALMAGRLTMLLASGVEPENIAAITFGELAASALSIRVHRFVDELLDGRIPDAMRPALPLGLKADQTAALALAAGKLDGLTTATIHAFCQTIICSYAVESDIDPGARILDAAQATMAFDAVFDQWLTRRLNGPARPGDPIISLSRDDPRRVVSTLQGLARFRLEHRSAHALPGDLTGRPDIDLAEAVSDFRRWTTAQPAEPKTLELVGELEKLADFYAGSFAPPPDFPRLWDLAHPPKLACMRRDSCDLLTPRRKSAWEKIAGKDTGSRLNGEAERYFERVDHCYRVILGRIATALVSMLSEELDEVLDDYAAFKRAAAVLDFDDLLERAQSLVQGHDNVRRALGARYRHIFVDEFQDTDPIQAEIMFLIASEARAPRWQDSAVRAGALFMVGDPKQAIYQFRGANVGSYEQARAAIERQWPANIIQITANFRSRPDILKHINQCFRAPLSAPGQPGYVALAPTIDPPDHDLPCATKITIELPPDPRAAEVREAEAAAVAELCARLIGNLQVRNEDGTRGRLAPGGIALLSPTSTELWRYERALEERGLPIASQAGKGLWRRQEVQDLLILSRALADARDTLAFGALMRGPLVGLSEEELLDITAALPAPLDHPDAIPRFSLLTDPSQVSHPAAHGTLLILRGLRQRSRATTPMLLLAEAAERLSIRPLLAARDGDRSARSAANVEAFLERARPYGVRGLKRFVRDASRDWKASLSCAEGRVDAEGDAIEIITIHSSKGLEWPVVIPINTVTLLRSREPFVHRASDDTLHWVVGDVVPPDLRSALQSDGESLTRERERLWYVACTRAREVLIVPNLPQSSQTSWAKIVDLGHRDLPEVDLSRFDHAAPTPAVDPPNLQTPDIFGAERAAVIDSAVRLTWLRPSDHDADRMSSTESIVIDSADAPEAELPVGAGRLRGLLLHKLMEEVLTGELREELAAFAERTRRLIDELSVDFGDGAVLPDTGEIAETVYRTLRLPDIVTLRPRLIPELPIYAMLTNQTNPTGLAGRVDAVAVEDGRASVVLDWKSDIAPTENDVRTHAEQLRIYLFATGAPRGALVYMTLGTLHWVEKSP